MCKVLTKLTNNPRAKLIQPNSNNGWVSAIIFIRIINIIHLINHKIKCIIKKHFTINIEINTLALFFVLSA